MVEAPGQAGQRNRQMHLALALPPSIDWAERPDDVWRLSAASRDGMRALAGVGRLAMRLLVALVLLFERLQFLQGSSVNHDTQPQARLRSRTTP